MLISDWSSDVCSSDLLEIRPKFPLLNNSKRAMRGFNFGMISRAYPDSVAARGKSSIVRPTPSARKTDRFRQVPWLPDHHAPPAFPDGLQWPRSEHSPVTVARAARVHGYATHYRLP